jgi:hypothetical protein
MRPIPRLSRLARFPARWRSGSRTLAEPRSVRLLHIGAALPITLTAAVATTGLLRSGALAWLGVPDPAGKAPTVSELLEPSIYENTNLWRRSFRATLPLATPEWRTCRKDRGTRQRGADSRSQVKRIWSASHVSPLSSSSCFTARRPRSKRMVAG